MLQLLKCYPDVFCSLTIKLCQSARHVAGSSPLPASLNTHCSVCPGAGNSSREHLSFEVIKTYVTSDHQIDINLFTIGNPFVKCGVESQKERYKK
jgi:hypothetical protein